jgi:hypothetical protein
MVMATFIALFLVGLVYHVAGVGQAALEQQTVQDGADAVAYSNAAAKARGMNLLALINLVMSAALAVLVALKVLQAILAVAIAAVGVACIVTQGAACGAMAPLGQALDKVTSIADKVEPRIKDVLDGLEKASDEINDIVPLLAQAEAVYISARGEYDPVVAGFAWPVTDPLPTKKGSFEDLCERAGEDVVRMSTFFLPGGLPEMAQSTVGELVGGLAGTFSGYFCGGSDAPPPDSMTQEVPLPLSDHHECDDAAARPSEAEGGCATAQCDQCAAWGCAACIGLMKKSEYVKGLWTRRVDRFVEWPDVGGGTSVSVEDPGTRELVWLGGDPCDGEGHCGAGPICITEEREEAGVGYPADAERVTRTAFLDFHGCLVKRKIETKVEGEPLDPDEWAKPRVLDEELLPEGLRVRGFVLSGSGRGARRRKVAIAGGGGPAFGLDGRVAFAGADFLSAAGDLWHMDWRSRLVRFRFPADGGSLSGSCAGEFAADCQQVGGQVDGLGDGQGLVGLLDGFGIDGFILH